MSDSSLQARGNAIYEDTTTDLSASIGKLCTFAAGIPAVNASATVPAVGIILDARTRQLFSGGTTTYQNALGIMGALPGPCRALISGSSAALAFGDRVMQAADGTLTKEVTGSPRVVVGIMTDANGAVVGDFTEISFFAPLYLTY